MINTRPKMKKWKRPNKSLKTRIAELNTQGEWLDPEVLKVRGKLQPIASHILALVHSSFRTEKTVDGVAAAVLSTTTKRWAQERVIIYCVDPQQHLCYYPQELNFRTGCLSGLNFFSSSFFDRITRKAFLNLQRESWERHTLLLLSPLFRSICGEEGAGDWCSYIFLPWRHYYSAIKS